jgi:hypothetical protein
MQASWMRFHEKFVLTRNSVAIPSGIVRVLA